MKAHASEDFGSPDNEVDTKLPSKSRAVSNATLDGFDSDDSLDFDFVPDVIINEVDMMANNILQEPLVTSKV